MLLSISIELLTEYFIRVGEGGGWGMVERMHDLKTRRVTPFHHKKTGVLFLHHRFLPVSILDTQSAADGVEGPGKG